MPGLGIKRVLQATPVGYLAEMEDGSQATFPEHVLVQAGYVDPTPGLYKVDPGQSPGVQPSMAQPAPQPELQPPQAPGLGVAPLEAPQVAPPPPPSPGPAPMGPGDSARMGRSVSTSTPGYLQREKAFGPAPAAVDLSAEREGLQAAGAEMGAGYAEQRQALADQGSAAAGLGQVKGEVATAQAGESREFLRAQTEFNNVANEYVSREQARINERVARVPQEDPSKIWGDNSMFQNAAGLFAAMAGGMLAVSTGSGRNMGLEAIERAIDRSINAQRTNIENEWRRVAHDKDSLQQFQDWKSKADLWAKEQHVVMLETLALDREAEAQKFSSASKQAELVGQAAQIRVQQAQKFAELTESLAGLAKAEADGALNRWKALGDAAVQRSAVAENYAQARAADRANQPDAAAGQGPIPVFKLPNGEQLYLDPRMTQGRTPAQIGEMANKLGEETAKYAIPLDQLQRHRQLVAEVGSKYSGPGSRTRWSDGDVRVVQDSLKRTSAAIAKSMSGTQYAEAFRAAVEGWTGGAPGWTGGDPMRSQTQYIEDMIADMERDLGGRGVVKGQAVTIPGVQGPTESGAPVRPEMRGEKLVPFNAQESFYRGDVVKNDDKDLVTAAKDLGRVVLTGSDPSSTLQALSQLDSMLKSPLAVSRALGDQVFGAVELSDRGGKTAARYPGEGKAQAGTSPRTKEDGVRLMKLSAMRAAAKADAAGDSELAGNIMAAADQLADSLTREEPLLDTPQDPYAKGFPGMR